MKEQQSDIDDVLKHIRSIFDAYLRRDRYAIRELHPVNWVGFQGPSDKIERGIDAYMRNAEYSLQHLKGTGYEILDTEIQSLGEVVLVYYVARYEYLDESDTPKVLPLRSLDVYRHTGNHWTQIGSHISAIPSGGTWALPPKR